MQCSILTPRALRWLENGRPARVLNLFDEVCNLVDEEGDVISLAAAGIGPGPFTIIVDQDFTPYLDANQPVEVDPSKRAVSIGSLSFYTDQAILWNPRPEWARLQKGPLLNQSIRSPLEPRFAVPLQRLLRGIKRGSTAESRSGALSLAGLGNGLTPSGDDILMGVLYGLWVWYPNREWVNLIAAAAIPRTTTLSAAYLSAAAEGEATIHWHDLVNGRADAVDQILSIGHTSGQDAWAGFTHAGHAFGLDGNQAS